MCHGQKSRFFGDGRPPTFNRESLSRRAHRSLLLLEQQKASTGLSHEPFQAPRETCQSYTLDCCKNKGYQGYTS